MTAERFVEATLFDPTTASPSEVVRELWRRLEAEDYEGAAALHTPAFAEHSAGDAHRDASPEPRRPRTTEDLLALDPEMPREVAEYEAAQYRKQPAPSAYFGSVFGVESRVELEALSSGEILARRLQAMDWRTRLRPHLEQLAEQHPEYRDQLDQQREDARSQWRGQVAGHVISGSRAYVIVEQHAGPLDEHPADWSPLVVTLRTTEEGWRVSSDLTDRSYLVHFHITVTDADGRQVVLS